MSYAHFKAAWMVGDCSAERAIAVMLGWFADESGRIAASNAVIAHLVCASEATVSKHLRGLAAKGAIEVRQRGRGKDIQIKWPLLDEWPDGDNTGRLSCHYCEKHGRPMELDHVVARSKGGTDDYDNLAVACIVCNTDKGNLDLAEWLALR